MSTEDVPSPRILRFMNGSFLPDHATRHQGPFQSDEESLLPDSTFARHRDAARPLGKPVPTDAARFVPTWDTLEPSDLIDFMFDRPVVRRSKGPQLWLFQTDRQDVPTLSDLWLMNGMAVMLPLARVSLVSTELRQSRGVRQDASSLLYPGIQPGEAVRVETLDTLNPAAAPRALWFEIATNRGTPLHLSAGPDRWQNLPLVLLSK